MSIPRPSNLPARRGTKPGAVEVAIGLCNCPPNGGGLRPARIIDGDVMVRPAELMACKCIPRGRVILLFNSKGSNGCPG